MRPSQSEPPVERIGAAATSVQQPGPLQSPAALQEGSAADVRRSDDSMDELNVDAGTAGWDNHAERADTVSMQLDAPASAALQEPQGRAADHAHQLDPSIHIEVPFEERPQEQLGTGVLQSNATASVSELETCAMPHVAALEALALHTSPVPDFAPVSESVDPAEKVSAKNSIPADVFPPAAAAEGAARAAVSPDRLPELAGASMEPITVADEMHLRGADTAPGPQNPHLTSQHTSPPCASKQECNTDSAHAHCKLSLIHI